MATITAPTTTPTRRTLRQWVARIWAHPAVRDGGTAWLSTRAIYAVLTLVAGMAPAGYPLSGKGPSLGDLIARWGFWDTEKWTRIAVHGYGSDPHLPAFFPLMAVFDWLGMHLLPGVNPAFIALAIGNLATLVAFIALADLVGAQARPFLRLYTAYPWMIFLASGYSDTLGAATVFAALAAARRRWYPLAGVVALLAGLARPTSLALIVPLILIVAERERLDYVWRWWRVVWREWHTYLPRIGVPTLVLAGAVPAGIGLYVLYCDVALHDPSAFLHAQALYGRVPFNPARDVVIQWRVWWDLAPFSTWHWREALDLAPFLIAIPAIPLVWRRLGAMWGTFLLSTVLLIVLAPQTGAQYPYLAAGRYLALAAPVPLLAVPWLARHPEIERITILLGWAMQAVMLDALFHGAWII